MLKPYETKLANIKEEILKIGADVIDSLELSLNINHLFYSLQQ